MQPSTPCQVLHKIPVRSWVLRTAQKMQAANTEARADWSCFWLETYWELGGFSEESGSKWCPQAAAYGLWFLGHLRGSSRAAQQRTVPQVDQELGKNAAYAVIAAELLKEGASLSASNLWPLAQARYQQLTGKEPAGSEQGQIRLVIALFYARLLI